jgi:hypothetical protein
VFLFYLSSFCVLFTVLSVSLDCPLFNAPSVFSQIYCPHTLDIFESASTPFYEILFLRRLQVMQLFDSVLQINMFFLFFFWFFFFFFFFFFFNFRSFYSKALLYNYPMQPINMFLTFHTVSMQILFQYNKTCMFYVMMSGNTFV